MYLFFILIIKKIILFPAAFQADFQIWKLQQYKIQCRRVPGILHYTPPSGTHLITNPNGPHTPPHLMSPTPYFSDWFEWDWPLDQLSNGFLIKKKKKIIKTCGATDGRGYNDLKDLKSYIEVGPSRSFDPPTSPWLVGPTMRCILWRVLAKGAQVNHIYPFLMWIRNCRLVDSYAPKEPTKSCRTTDPDLLKEDWLHGIICALPNYPFSGTHKKIWTHQRPTTWSPNLLLQLESWLLID